MAPRSNKLILEREGYHLNDQREKGGNEKKTRGRPSINSYTKNVLVKVMDLVIASESVCHATLSKISC